MDKQYYFYISFLSPFGPGGLFYKGKEHPLAIKAYREKQVFIARQLSLSGAKQIVQPDSIVFISLIELPEEVIKERFPDKPEQG